MVLTMIRARTPEHLIYAYIRTGGLILNERSYETCPVEDRDAWDLAVQEFERHLEQPQ